MNQIVDSKLFQLQHDGAQIRSQNLRIRLILHFALVRLLRVQAKALAGARSTGATGSLLGARLRDGRHQQGLDTNTRIVDLEEKKLIKEGDSRTLHPCLLFRKSRINDEDDAVDCQRGFGYVGCHDDFSSECAVVSIGRRRFEDALLHLRRKRRIERNALHFADIWSKILDLPMNLFTGLFDFLTKKNIIYIYTLLTSRLSTS